MDKGEAAFGSDSKSTLPQKTMMERMLAGELFKWEDAEVAKSWEDSQVRCARYNAEGPLVGAERRRAMLAQILGSLGAGSDITPPFYCQLGSNIHIGERTFLNFNCVILDPVEVSIGDDTLVGPAVQFLAVEHPRSAEMRLSKVESGRPIHIGRNVWIGGGAIILPGVHVGDGAIVGAGAVVSKDVSAGATVVGVPARPIGGDEKKKRFRLWGRKKEVEKKVKDCES